MTTSYRYTDYGMVNVTGDDQRIPTPAGIGELEYNPFQYSGEYTYRDGTQALGPRTFDPVQARFLEKDDAPLANLYAYVSLNPITKVDPSGRWERSDTANSFLTTVGYLVALGGAALMITTPGVLFTAFGAIGFGVALGDMVVTGVQVVQGLSRVEFTDDEALTAASHAFFGASLLVGVGGVVGALAKRGVGKAAKTCMELMDLACLGGNADEAVGILKAARSSTPPKLTSASEVTADGLLENLRVMNGWNESLKNAKFETLPLIVTDLRSESLTTGVESAMRALQKAQTEAAGAMQRVFQFDTAQGANDFLTKSIGRLRAFVETGVEELGHVRQRVTSQRWSDADAADEAGTQLTAFQEELELMLKGPRDSFPDLLVEF
ncbi:RHS repeat-associated core domain-containing protein [Agromyces aerolatus]|uniref:RHS repeat-associated core domain-containing protein n=1 Tax=Agromyces sp. LY-1074 TaxID=3074080 RepID=UPI0028547083|nr:RHS repeat-associated core domain-containing protein [Agromyces sp. LY-1074]MDR5700383.1 RHS repeat-associated core domain-containing protein [Agromyces sp. LY-1074]